MSFNSIQYLFFLPIVFAFYWLIPQKLRWILLLAASYYFYMSWNAKYVFLILFTTSVTFFCALFLEKCVSGKQKKLFLILSLVSCLGVLAFFKYFNFGFRTLDAVLSCFSIHLHPVTLKLLLPVGISFYTFQALGYVIDVYRGKKEAERHFGYYAAFLSFFPLLAAGPIERSNNLLPQIKTPCNFDYELAREGLLMMAWGFFKKSVIADTLAIYSDKIFNNVFSYSGFSLVVASLFYTIQIYCDFSGYSDIAIGTARLFGIKLMDNFKSPYFSSSIKEFWGRWHISLSTWFRDYVYIPLGGNRVSKVRHKLNLLITFLVSGLWHGADWTFVVWGGIHGLGQIVESFFKRKNKDQSAWVKALKIIVVFCFVSIAWVFFRANSFQEAFHFFTHAFAGITNPVRYLYKGYRDIYMSVSLIIRVLIMIMILAIHDAYAVNHNVQTLIKKIPRVLRWAGYLAFVWMLFAFMPIGADQEFIYFQF